MKIVISDTLATSIQRLPQNEQAIAKQTAFDFQVNPAQPGLKLHKIDKSLDKNFWSIRVNQDLRMILHKVGDTAVLCYVDHHDSAYRWAENRRLETHPETGAAQFVLISERVEEVVKKVHTNKEPAIFAGHDKDYLLALGVPEEYLDAVKAIGRSELDKLIDVLPEEATERLLELAEGKLVPRPIKLSISDPFSHPDAQRRFKVIDSSEELKLALEAGWDRWVVFLHPGQRAAVERNYSGAAKVSGSAGTGKTVAALHRTAHLLKTNPKGRVLLTTFSTTLASRLEQQITLLVASDSAERKRLSITNLHKLARDFWVEKNRKPLKVIDEQTLTRHTEQCLRSTGSNGITAQFVRSEWNSIIDPYNIKTWDTYKNFSRAGRGTPLGVKQKKQIWTVIEKLRASMEAIGAVTWDMVCHEVADSLRQNPSKRFDHVVADEVQDFGYADLVLLRALAVEGKNDLFLCGDPGQRIYKMKTSWAAAGINVKGRSTRLKVNYRTTEQIRRFSDRLLAESLQDSDGAVESRDTVSLLFGAEPEIVEFATPEEEIDGVSTRLRVLAKQGYKPRDIAIFGRTEEILGRAQQALELTDMSGVNLKDEETLPEDSVAVGTMHRAKGLEFKVVIVMGCEKGQLPLPVVFSGLADPADVEAAREQEKSLLYVAATRAREHVLLTYSGVRSEFLG